MRFPLKWALFLCTLLPVAAATVKPDSVGLSEERLQRISDTVKRHIEARNVTGGVTLVARKGRIAHLQAHGLMDVESNKSMATDAIFRIYSMTKPVAGIAILMLMEEGKVRLTDPVSAFIPQFKEMKVAVPLEKKPGITAPQPDSPEYYTIPASREITIQDLLTHVSGLGSGAIGNTELRRVLEKLELENLAAFVPKFATTPLDFQPGSKWSYSPLAAFDTLGRVVEVASGLPFDQFLKQRLFQPLGMKETFFHPGDLWSRVVTAYTRADGALKKTENPNRLVSKTYFSGGGGLMSTAEDYAQFAMMLAEGGQLNGKRLLSPKTVELLSSVFVPDTLSGRQPGRGYGLSMQVVSDPIAAGYRVSRGSFGWDGAYGTHFWVDPKEKLVGILMIQTSNPNRQFDRDFENAVMQAIVE